MTYIKYLLSLNRYSRSGKKTNNPKGIVLHHGECDGYGAIETRNYFDNLKIGKNAVYYSTHYVVGFNGEVVCCVPEEEVANHRGNCKESQGYISITCCNTNKCRKPEYNTLLSLKALVRDIIRRYDMDIDSDFLRHYDISGINCPVYYVANVEEWEGLKAEIRKEMEIEQYFRINSEAVAQKLSKVLDMEKKVATDVLQEKAQFDISTLRKIEERLRL